MAWLAVTSPAGVRLRAYTSKCRGLIETDQMCRGTALNLSPWI